MGYITDHEFLIAVNCTMYMGFPYSNKVFFVLWLVVTNLVGWMWTVIIIIILGPTFFAI